MPSPQTRVLGGDGTSVATYALAPGVFQYIESVLVEVDNAGGPDIAPVLRVTTQDGAVIATQKQDETIPAGDTGSATFALGLRKSLRGFIRYVAANVGAWLSVTATGQGGPFNAGIDLNSVVGPIVLRGDGGVNIIPDTGGVQLGGGAQVTINPSGDVRIQIQAGKVAEVRDHNSRPIFRVDEDGDLHGLTGKALVFDLPL